MPKIKFKLDKFYSFFAKLSKKERTILYVALTVVSLTILDRLIVYPIFSKIDLLTQEIKQKESDLRREVRIVAQKDRINAEVKKFDSYLQAPNTEDEIITTLLKEVEGIANKSSLYIVDMKPAGTREENKGDIRYLVTMNCEGQMEQIMDFLYNIENSGSLLTVERYQISPKSRESSIAVCSLTISKVIIK